MISYRRLFAVAIFIISVVFLFWGFWPWGTEDRSLDLSPADLTPQDTAESGALALPEMLSSGGRLELHWQTVIRKGDAGQVRLTLRQGEQGNQIPGPTLVNQEESKSGAYHVLAEARLEIAGPDVSPSGIISQSIIPDQPAVFSWTLSPQEAGVYQGTVWFTLHYLPIAGGEEISKTISAQQFEFRSADLLRLDSSSVRYLGFGGLILAAIISWYAFFRKASIDRKNKYKRGM